MIIRVRALSPEEVGQLTELAHARKRGAGLVRRALRRKQVLAFFAKLPACLVGIEACATAHYWGREIAKLGHDVRLIPPAYAKAYVWRNKNDAADAATICEAVSRPRCALSRSRAKSRRRRPAFTKYVRCW